MKAYNTELALTLTFGENAEVYPTIMTQQIEKGRGKPKAKVVLPSYCPFCGVKYEH